MLDFLINLNFREAVLAHLIFVKKMISFIIFLSFISSAVE